MYTLSHIYNAQLKHKLIETAIPDEFRFTPAEDWMPIYETTDPITGEILAVDTDGLGRTLAIGDDIEGREIEKIRWDSNGILIRLSKI